MASESTIFPNEPFNAHIFKDSLLGDDLSELRSK
jgi:hypothetical protein